MSPLVSSFVQQLYVHKAPLTTLRQSHREFLMKSDSFKPTRDDDKCDRTWCKLQVKSLKSQCHCKVAIVPCDWHFLVYLRVEEVQSPRILQHFFWARNFNLFQFIFIISLKVTKQDFFYLSNFAVYFFI